MVARILDRLASAPTISRKDILLTLLPALIWAGLVFARPALIHPFCATEPARCTAQSVLPIDRVALGLEIKDADGYSFWTQNASGILAAVAPILWSASNAALGTLSPATALAWIGTDFLIYAQTTIWNGMINETVRVTIQRPRPFVYADPVRLGTSPAHYISFYSGHTSYSAAVCVALFLILLSRGAPLWLLGSTMAIGQGLVISTAVFRILAGRHFVTDVVTAAIMGTFVALGIALAHRRKQDS